MEEAYHNMQDFIAIMPPIGLLCIAASLETVGVEVEILDAEALGLSLDEAVEMVAALEPDYVGSTSMTAIMDIKGTFYTKLKEKLPDVVTMVGGPHASAMPTQTLVDFPGIDISVIGEGDYTVLEILDALENRGVDGLAEVDGIAFKNSTGELIETALRRPIKRLAELPPPAYHLLDFSLYRSYGWNSWSKGNRAPLGVVFTGRGCVGKCNFCASQSVFGKGVRYFPVEDVLKIIEMLVEEQQVKVLYFLDDTFTANRKMVKTICEFMIERGYNTHVESMVSSRVDCVDMEMFMLMRKAGVKWVCFGVESGNERVLKDMGKRITLDQIRSAFKIARDSGMAVAGNFMIGHIGETWESAMETIELACELPEDYASIAVAIPLPGTGLYRHCVDNNIKLPTWQEFGSVNTPPISLNPTLNSKELMALRDLAVNRFFKRPKYLIGLMFRFNPYYVISDFLKMYLALRAERKDGRWV